MDLLFSRYASPFLLLDSMIGCGRFLEFVSEIHDMNNERVINDTLFDTWLHKDFENGYYEFRRLMKQPIEVESQDIDFETTINCSRDILKNFNPNDR